MIEEDCLHFTFLIFDDNQKTCVACGEALDEDFVGPEWAKHESEKEVKSQ